MKIKYFKTKTKTSKNTIDYLEFKLRAQSVAQVLQNEYFAVLINPSTHNVVEIKDLINTGIAMTICRFQSSLMVYCTCAFLCTTAAIHLRL